MFKLNPKPVVFGDLDPTYTGLFFSDSKLEKPDLTSIMPDTVPEDIRSRVILAMEEVHTRNLERVQNLDFTVKEIYSIVVGLVNYGMEVMTSW